MTWQSFFRTYLTFLAVTEICLSPFYLLPEKPCWLVFSHFTLGFIPLTPNAQPGWAAWPLESWMLDSSPSSGPGLGFYFAPVIVSTESGKLSWIKDKKIQNKPNPASLSFLLIAYFLCICVVFNFESYWCFFIGCLDIFISHYELSSTTQTLTLGLVC